MKVAGWLGLMMLIFTSAPLVYAQVGAGATIQTGIQQVPGTSTTDSVKRTKEVGPQGQVVEKEEKTTSSKKDHAAYKYSGLPCKWTGGVANTGSNANLLKDTGPRRRYTVDRLPLGANPDEALWVKMDDGRMMMVDPKHVQNLR
jgi:hypothetical protein